MKVESVGSDLSITEDHNRQLSVRSRVGKLGNIAGVVSRNFCNLVC